MDAEKREKIVQDVMVSFGVQVTQENMPNLAFNRLMKTEDALRALALRVERETLEEAARVFEEMASAHVDQTEPGVKCHELDAETLRRMAGEVK